MIQVFHYFKLLISFSSNIISLNYFNMTETREWTQYEDQILHRIRDQEGVQKWSTIAQKMAEQHGIKGRNGKQCKQRYMQVFDQNKSVLHWDYQTEQLMFMLHDKIGNKWAAIGQQLQNRTDNDVKNHFYSKIRKGLRRINYIIKDKFKKEFKQVKQTVLYKIIQGSEDRFSATPIHEEDVWNFCIEAKNYLLRMSYDEDEYNPWNDFKVHQQTIKQFIQNLSYFSKEFKRKPKLFKKNDQEQESLKLASLQTNCRMPYQSNSKQNQQSYDQELLSSQIQQSQSQSEEQQKMNIKAFSSIFQIQQVTLSVPMLQKKAQKINPVIILKSSSELSQMMLQQNPNLESRNSPTSKSQKNIMSSQSLLPCIPKLLHISSKVSNAMIDEEDQDNQNFQSFSKENHIQNELMKDGLLQQDDQKNCHQLILFNGNNSKNITSKGSNFSSYSIDQEEQVHFFEQDSTLNMRIYTTGVGGKRTKQMEQSIQKSDKLFKSLERGQQLFESLGSRGQRDLKMSIQRSGDLRHSNSLFQSVGR